MLKSVVTWYAFYYPHSNYIVKRLFSRILKVFLLKAFA
ncbi:hypothetical protein [Proteus phage RP7]|nr:hypothetical protein [Proteus phage RP7]